jgi:hypothetical protein
LAGTSRKYDRINGIESVQDQNRIIVNIYTALARYVSSAFVSFSTLKLSIVFEYWCSAHHHD